VHPIETKRGRLGERESGTPYYSLLVVEMEIETEKQGNGHTRPVYEARGRVSLNKSGKRRNPKSKIQNRKFLNYGL